MNDAQTSDGNSGCHKLDLLVDTASEESVQSGIAQIARVVFPSRDVSKLSVRALTGGTTNRLYVCEYPPESETFLCRIYGEGTDKFIDRDAEIRNMHILHEHAMGPHVYCTFLNGLCYEYFHGETFDVGMATSEEHAHLIPEHLALMHSIPSTSTDEKEAKIEGMLKQYLALVPSTTIESAEKDLEIEFGKGINIRREVSSIIEVIRSIECAVVFCHNDLTMRNVILGETGIHFIDYEYASRNHQAYDIGNFFTAFCAGEVYDRSLYPKRDWQLEWIRIYLSEYARIKGNDAPTEADVNKLCVEANKLALASLLLWGIWALIQVGNSTLDANFMDLALSPLGLYFSKKVEILAS